MNKVTILIVDDTPANLKTLAGILKQEYRLVISKSGEGAIELIEKGERPDVILLDIMMPGIDGYEVCRRLKQKDETRQIPIIFITAKSEEEEKRKGLSLGAAAYITKPFDVETVRRIVREVL